MKKPKPTLKGPAFPAQVAGETSREYAHFVAFCMAPAGTRTVEGAFHTSAGTKGAKGENRRRPPGSFFRTASRWRWKERAGDYDQSVLALEAAALEAARKKARTDRAALAEKFVASASALLDDATILAGSPGAVSAAILRALVGSRHEHEVDLLLRGRANAHGGMLLHGPEAEPPVVTVFLDMGDGRPQPLTMLPPPDQVNPHFNPLDGTTSLPPAANVGAPAESA